MKNSQPIVSRETLPNGNMSPDILMPRLTLPQVMPAQVIAKRQHSYGGNTLLQQKASQITPFPHTAMMPPSTEPLPIRTLALQTKREASCVSLWSGPQVPFPKARLDFSRSLRSGITYIPRSMTRHKEPDMADAMIACSTLIIISLFLLTLLYCFIL